MLRATSQPVKGFGPPNQQQTCGAACAPSKYGMKAQCRPCINCACLPRGPPFPSLFFETTSISELALGSRLMLGGKKKNLPRRRRPPLVSVELKKKLRSRLGAYFGSTAYPTSGMQWPRALTLRVDAAAAAKPLTCLRSQVTRSNPQTGRRSMESMHRNQATLVKPVCGRPQEQGKHAWNAFPQTFLTRTRPAPILVHPEPGCQALFRPVSQARCYYCLCRPRFRY